MGAKKKIQNKRISLAEFKFSDKQLKLFDIAVDECRFLINQINEFRLKVADIITSFEVEMFGKHPSITEQNIVRALFAKKLGYSFKAIDDWVKVKTELVDKVAPKKIEKFNYSQKLQIVERIKHQKKKPTEAIIEHMADLENPYKKALVLIERYSSELLTQCRKIDEYGTEQDKKNNSDIFKKVAYKIGECRRILNG